MVSIEFDVQPDPLHAGSRAFTMAPLGVTPADLALVVSSLRAPGFGPANFTIDYYLRTVILALDYGSSGQSFELAIERENLDLRRVVSEAFGAAAGALLLNRDLGADWRTMVQIDGRHLRRLSGRWRRRRPDILCRTPVGTVLLECKGTTSVSSVTGMLERAYRQVKYARLRRGRISGRYLTCTYVPLAGDGYVPTLWVGDPEGPEPEGESFEIDERVVDKALWQHYARVANMAGLERLAGLLWKRSGEQDGPLVPESEVEREFELAEERMLEFNNRRLIARTIEIPILPSRIPSGSRCPRYIVSIGLDNEVAHRLKEGADREVRRETNSIREVRQDLRAFFRDGAGIIINARSEEGDLDPRSWWTFEASNSRLI